MWDAKTSAISRSTFVSAIRITIQSRNVAASVAGSDVAGYARAVSQVSQVYCILFVDQIV